MVNVQQIFAGPLAQTLWRDCDHLAADKSGGQRRGVMSRGTSPVRS